MRRFTVFFTAFFDTGRDAFFRRTTDFFSVFFTPRFAGAFLAEVFDFFLALTDFDFFFFELDRLATFVDPFL